jgi:hypothetical protein
VVRAQDERGTQHVNAAGTHAPRPRERVLECRGGAGRLRRGSSQEAEIRQPQRATPAARRS